MATGHDNRRTPKESSAHNSIRPNCRTGRVGRTGGLVLFDANEKQELRNAKPIEVELELPCAVVDLFHNGADGHRAQYYLSVEHGEAASRYLVQSLRGDETAQSRAGAKFAHVPYLYSRQG